MAGFCEHGDEASGSIKRDYQVSNNVLHHERK
jgi:hypothetical protein